MSTAVAAIQSNIIAPQTTCNSYCSTMKSICFFYSLFINLAFHAVASLNVTLVSMCIDWEIYRYKIGIFHWKKLCLKYWIKIVSNRRLWQFFSSVKREREGKISGIPLLGSIFLVFFLLMLIEVMHLLPSETNFSNKKNCAFSTGNWKATQIFSQLGLFTAAFFFLLKQIFSPDPFIRKHLPLWL